ncbi:2-oxoglutarate dehydrogenase complex E2 component [Collariella sp. IMI 366227]|nr:2-oxoglutarate dehydrogenase complex E2 component [Collariella sp. IMI 366227]
MYRGLRLAARAAPKLSLYNTSAALRQLPLQFQHVRTYADKIVKVPTMAESISEGTLKQWNKAIGDFVEQDEEIATIETDKIDVAVNAPEAGVIKEFLVNEEDTVTVGQDLLRLELGGAPSGDKPAEDAKAAPKEEPKKEAAPEQTKAPEPKPQETKPAAPASPKKETPAPKQETKSRRSPLRGPPLLATARRGG